MDSQPGSSKDDPLKPRAKKSRSIRDSNISGQSQQNSPGIFYRVTNSVSGLLSNVSWSDWLNNSIVKNGGESKNTTTEKQVRNISNTTNNQQLFVSEVPKKKFLDPLYPEEGIIDINSSKIESRFLEVSNSENTFLPEMEYSCFEKARPIYSSTPSIGLLHGNKNAGKIERTRGDGLSPIPSTSDVCNEASIFIENSLGLLRKSLYNNQDDNTFSKLNGSLSASANKKRLRDQNYIIEESEAQESNVESNLQSILPLKDSSDAPLKKRPRFNISSFGSPLFEKQDQISSKQDMNDSSLSVFYPGKTMYGGAFNYQKHPTRFANRKIIPRANLPSNVNSSKDFEDGGLSTAAKRILNCIDKISTPLSNSKRIYFSKQREPDSPSYVADFHKHRPSLKANGDISSPPVAKLLTPGKARVNHIPSLIEKNSMTSNSNSCNGAKKNPSINSSNFTTSAQVKNIVNSSKEFPINSNLCKLPLLPFPTTTVSHLDKGSEIKEINELKCTKPTQTVMKSTISSSTNMISGSVTDFLLNDRHKSPVKNIGSFSFSMPIPFDVPSGISKELSHSESFKFTFSNPIEVDGLTEPKTSSLSKIGFGDSFKVPSGSWECEICLIQNMESATSCIACTSAKPNSFNSKVSTTEVSMPKISENNWGDAFLPPKGVWDCSVCLVQNQDCIAHCVACESIRPGLDSSSSDKKFVESSNAVSSLVSCQTSERSWECHNCHVKNVDSTETCISCKNLKSSFSKEINTWGEKFKPSMDTWDCDICLLQNSINVTSCAACQASRPGKGGDSALQTTSFSVFQNIEKSIDTTASDKTPSNFKFGCGSTVPFSSNLGSESGKSLDEWQCETCLVRNKLTSNKCTSCEAPKNKLSSSTFVSEAMTGNFKFSAFNNMNNTSLASTTKFSAAPTVGASSSIGSFSFKASEGFKSNSTSSETNNKLHGIPTFSFGLKNGNEKVDSSNIASSSINTSSSSLDAQANSPFINSTAKELEIKSSSESSFSFGKSLSGKNSDAIFSFRGSENNKISEKNSENLSTNLRDKESNVTLHAEKVDNGESASSEIFKGFKNPLELKPTLPSNTEPNKQAVVSTTFSFGDTPKSTNEASKILKTNQANEKKFTFGNPLIKGAELVSTPTFSFNSVLSKDSNEATSKASTFQPPKDSGSALTPVFSFNTVIPKNSNEVTSKPSTFQPPKDAGSASTPIFSFYSALPKNSNEAPSKTGTFQTPKDAGSASTPGFSFNSVLPINSIKATSKAGTFQSPKDADSAPVFSFNSALSKDSIEATSTGGSFQPPKFTFGQNVSNDKEKLPNPSSLFSFGESNPKPLNATFSFGGMPALVSKESPKFNFGDSGTTNESSFGGIAAGDKPQSIPFSFGESQPLKSSFNFGGDSSSSFSFGKPSEPTNNSSSLFQFRNQSKIADVPKSVAEPSFGSLESNPFNALAAPSAVSSNKRIIRKAVRRNK